MMPHWTSGRRGFEDIGSASSTYTSNICNIRNVEANNSDEKDPLPSERMANVTSGKLEVDDDQVERMLNFTSGNLDEDNVSSPPDPPKVKTSFFSRIFGSGGGGGGGGEGGEGGGCVGASKEDNQSLQFHLGIICNNCKKQGGIEGIRYKCNCCPDYNLCERCITSLESTKSTSAPFHNSKHTFTRVAKCINSSGLPQYTSSLMNRKNWKHGDLSCSFCNLPIVGFRYNCPICSLDICESCELIIDELAVRNFPSHNTYEHSLIKIRGHS